MLVRPRLGRRPGIRRGRVAAGAAWIFRGRVAANEAATPGARAASTGAPRDAGRDVDAERATTRAGAKVAAVGGAVEGDSLAVIVRAWAAIAGDADDAALKPVLVPDELLSRLPDVLDLNEEEDDDDAAAAAFERTLADVGRRRAAAAAKVAGAAGAPDLAADLGGLHMTSPDGGGLEVGAASEAERRRAVLACAERDLARVEALADAREGA